MHFFLSKYQKDPKRIWAKIWTQRVCGHLLDKQFSGTSAYNMLSAAFYFRWRKMLRLGYAFCPISIDWRVTN